MTKTKFLSWGGMLFALCAMLTISACSSDDEKDNGGTVTPQKPETEVNNGEMKFAAFYGVVRRVSTYGDPAAFEGVKVTTGDQTATTDANGYYQFDKVKTVNGRAVLRFEKAGFMTVVRSVPVQDNMRLDVTLKESQATGPFPSYNIKTLNLNTSDYSEKMVVDLPGDCYVTENGTHYEGNVTAEAVYLDPDDASFATQMPGDLSAIREDQSAAQLISYGMVAVELKGSNGEKLNLASDAKATLSFPIPDMFKENPPATIPLWSFNEETGLWEEEGVATLTGSFYIGQVSHFSWHNLDSPELTATIKVTVKDSNGKPLVGVPVDIGGQRQYFTDQNGKLKCDIPSECDVYVRVPSEYYGNYAQDDPSKEAKTKVNLGGGVTKEITLTVAAACSLITGKVTNTGAGSNVCTLTLSYFKEGLGWQQTGSVISDINGQFILYGPAGVTGAAMITASFNDGTSFTHNFELTGADQVVNFSVNSNSSIGAGVVTVKNESLGIKATYFLPAPKNGGYWEGAAVDGSVFTGGFTTQDKDYIDWEKGETVDMVTFGVNDYASGKTHFESGSFFWMKEGGPHLRIDVQNGAADITKNGDVYTFKMTDADGTLEDQMKNYIYVDVKVSVEISVKPGDPFGGQHEVQ